jgi:hypothetical protein
VVAELRNRVDDQRRVLGEPSRHILCALSDFEAQAAAVRKRLQSLAATPSLDCTVRRGTQRL